MRALRFLRSAATVLTLSFVAVPAFADVIAPDVGACDKKTAGASCEYTNGATAAKSGTCVNGTCTKLDYQNWDRDASSSPPTVSYDCLICDVDGGAPSGDGGPSVDASPTSSDGGGGSTTDAGSTSGGGSSDSGGCSIVQGDAKNLVGAWLLACVVPLVLVRIRRKVR